MRKFNIYIDFALSKTLKLLPESKFKENFQKIILRYYNNFYTLNKLIRKIELSNEADEEILLELANSLKFYGIPNKLLPGAYGINKQDCGFKYGNPKKLNKLREIDVDYFGDFLSILNTIFAKNIYERHYHFKEGDIVVDCGANIGAFTVKAARIVGKEGKIVAIEPEEHNLSILKKNIKINGLGNYVIIPKGLWSKRSRMKFFLGPASGWHSLIWKTDKFMERLFTEIEVDTLDNIMRELEIDKVDFIKMDIEGAEIEALKGMRETFANNDVKLAIEAFHRIDGKPTSETIIPQLRNIGFGVCEESGFIYAKKRRSFYD